MECHNASCKIMLYMERFNSHMISVAVNFFLRDHSFSRGTKMAAFQVRSRVLLCVLCVLQSVLHVAISECYIDLQSDLGNKAPLFLLSGDTVEQDGTAFIQPRMNTVTARLHNGEEVEFLCAGEGNRFNISGQVRDVNQIQGVCGSDTNFNFDGQSYALSNIRCTQKVESSIKDAGTCAGGNKRLQIGFPKAQNQFINLIDICFNEGKLIPSYLNYTLSEGIERRQMTEDLDNPDKTDYFNGLSNNHQSYYTCSNQQRAVGSILDSQALGSQKIVCSETSNYLIKTHLAPVSDFIYHCQQNSARYLINTVPMWQSIVNGNWEKLENEIRLYASNISRESSDLVIYTGTLDVTTLPNYRNVQKSLYLADGNKLPVPQWVWKAVYEPSAREGIVFILVNNPYRLRFAGCPCVCPRTKWTLEWNRQDRSKGYIYCCTVESFRNVYPNLPQFEVTGLLTKNRPYSPFGINVEPQK